MPGPHKITLAEAQESGASELAFYCHHTAAGCTRSGSIAIGAALDRWGGALRLDQVPARCTSCGSRAFIDVRPSYPAPKPDGVLDALIRKSWERS